MTTVKANFSDSGPIQRDFWPRYLMIIYIISHRECRKRFFSVVPINSTIYNLHYAGKKFIY